MKAADLHISFSFCSLMLTGPLDEFVSIFFGLDGGQSLFVCQMGKKYTCAKSLSMSGFSPTFTLLLSFCHLNYVDFKYFIAYQIQIGVILSC